MDDSRDEKEERGVTEANSKISDIEIEEWYQNLVDDCKCIITEAVFISRWALVEGYHQLGQRVDEDPNFTKYAKGNQTSVQDLARNLNISERTLYYAIQFYRKYPSLNSIPEGKNISWYKIITKYLSGPKENEIGSPIPQYAECPKCGHRFAIFCE